jgi:hypothetical protein
MSEGKIGVGIVIIGPNNPNYSAGTVPFDDDVSEEHRAHMIAHLVGLGHHVEPHRHHKGHFFIKNWKKPA